MANYYIYRIAEGSTGLIKQLQKIDQFVSYREAKNCVRQLRTEQTGADQSIYKIIFADSELDAEEKLQEKREPPVIEEWEK